FGQSPRAHQTELRLLKARQLLVSSNSQVIQVALDSGYRSLSLFNALFKRRFGMSPSELRRKMMKTNGKTLGILGIVFLCMTMALRPALGVPAPPSQIMDFGDGPPAGLMGTPVLLASAAVTDGVESFTPPPTPQP